MNRFNRLEAIRGSVVDVASKTDPGVLPYFIDNFDAGSRTGMEIPSESLDELVTEWVRGIHLCEVGEIIPRGYDVSVIHVRDQARAEAVGEISKHAKVVQKGPGIRLDIYHARENDEFMAFYAFDIWNVLKCSAVVERAGSYA